MNSYPSIEYFFHDGSTCLEPRYTNVSGIALLLNEARHTAQQDMEKSGAEHAIYGVKHYDLKNNATMKVDIYIPAVLLNETEFVKRTDTQKQLSPDCYILALHNRCAG